MNIVEIIIRINGLVESKEQICDRLDLLTELQISVQKNGCIELRLVQEILNKYKEYAYILSDINSFDENLSNEILELKSLAEKISNEISKLEHTHFLPNYTYMWKK